jgi:hypothetical protein
VKNACSIVCGIPTINRADLLEKCLADLAEKMPGLDVLVIDNGWQSIPYESGVQQIVESSDRNLGVPASWNRIMRWGFEEKGADYCLILNDDVKLGLTLKEIQDTIDKYTWWGFPPLLLNSPTCWAAFLIHKDAPRIVGEFDENFFPGWYEDEDYARRIMLACPNGHHPDQKDHISSLHAAPLDVPETLEMQPNGKMELMPAGLRVSGWGVVYRSVDELRPEEHWMSGTTDKSPEMVTADPLLYYIKKWGDGPREEKFTVPFERPVELTPEMEAKIRETVCAESDEPPKTEPGYRRGDEKYSPTKTYSLKRPK